MKRIPIILTIFILSTALYGCGVTKKSTMHRLKNKTDVVDAMILPDPTSSAKKAGSEELIDPDKFKNIPESPRLKKIRVTSDGTTLHKGPGVQYPKIGTAAKGDLFDLLRIERGYSEGQTWYLAEDAAGGKFFISSQSSTIFREKPEPVVETTQAQESIWPESLVNQETRQTAASQDRPEKVELQKRKKASINQIQTIVNVEPDLPPELREAKHITLNFEGTELYDVITTFCELLKIVIKPQDKMQSCQKEKGDGGTSKRNKR